MEQNYYLDCLLNVILKTGTQIGYIVPNLISILCITKDEGTDFFEKYKNAKNRDVCWHTKFKSYKYNTLYR